MSFLLAKFRFIFKATTTVRLPDYTGSTFRGAFGNTFKTTVCIRTDRDCQKCLIRDTCIYLWIFETPPPQEAPFLKQSGAAPHPFILEPQFEAMAKEIRPQSTFSIDLVLLGKAIDYLPYFVFVFQKMGQYGLGKGRGKYELLDVQDLLAAKGTSIFHASENVLSENFVRISSDELLQPDSYILSSPLTLNFQTPVRIKRDGRYVSRLDFPDLITTLTRRYFLINHFHGDAQGELAHKALIELSRSIQTVSNELTWYDWTRYSHRQRTKMKLGGLLGKITFEGELSPFVPLLRLGEYMHIGKNTSFGLGKYRIVNTSD